MLTRLTILFSICFATAAQVAGGPSDDRATNPRTVYFTVGDYQDNLFTPLDSAAGIHAAFEVLHDKYAVDRVWWRGGQDEVWGKQFEIREQSRRYDRVWNWWKDLQYRVVNTNAIAVKEGHARGMQIWMAYGLFDNGSSPDVGFGGFPYAAEDKIRIDHPEWVPVNRYGTWKQGGPIEFAYPGARKAMVDYLSKYVIDGGYDGIAFLTYVENHSMHFEDEFGYSQPIVDEYQKRYGVDIRTQAFDKDKWSKLRGEFLTQFMRELHTALAAAGKKIAVSTDGLDPHLPCKWNVAGGVRTVGRLHMDVDTWVKEKIVDEINLYYPNSDASLASVQRMCEGSGVKVSIFGHTRGDLPKAVDRIMTVNTEMESGFDWDHYVDFPDENVTPEASDTLTSKDVFARRRILTAILRGKHPAKASEVIPLLADPDLYVRRNAIRALATLKDKSAIPALEKSLQDPENGVRWQAAIALAALDAPNLIDLMMNVVGRDDGNYQFPFVVVPAALEDLQTRKQLSDAVAAQLIAHTKDPKDRVRESAWYAITTLALHDSPSLTDAALRTLREDPNPYPRELSLMALRNIPATPEIFAQVRKTLAEDKDVVVQVRAATTLADLTHSAGNPAEVVKQSLQDLSAAFKRYGGNCIRTDKDWGWREVGNAFAALGAEGDKALQDIMNDKQDTRLADLAWRVIYLPQRDGFTVMTEAQEADGHANHPTIKFPKVASGRE